MNRITRVLFCVVVSTHQRKFLYTFLMNRTHHLLEFCFSVKVFYGDMPGIFVTGNLDLDLAEKAVDKITYLRII